MVARQLGYPVGTTSSWHVSAGSGPDCPPMMVRHRVLAGYAAPYCSGTCRPERSVTSSLVLWKTSRPVAE